MIEYNTEEPLQWPLLSPRDIVFLEYNVVCWRTRVRSAIRDYKLLRGRAEESEGSPEHFVYEANLVSLSEEITSTFRLYRHVYRHLQSVKRERLK